MQKCLGGHTFKYIYREFNYLGQFISTHRAFIDTLHGHKYYVDLKIEPRHQEKGEMRIL